MNLFPDIKSMIFHAERNAWYIECVIFIDKSMYLKKDPLSIKGDYKHIYLPINLEHCLEIFDGTVFDAHIPTWDDHMEIQLQHISISGTDFDMITMDKCLELQKLETLRIKTPAEI